MRKEPLLVVGATGDVGQGVVEAALVSGRQVVAAGRDAAKLERIAARFATSSLACITGDIGDEDRAATLWEDAAQYFGSVEDVVVSVNAPNRMQALSDWATDELNTLLYANVLTHFVAAKTYLPRMSETGMLIGIGGGTADVIFPKMAHVSMGQAALRMLYRGLAREHREGATVRELMIVSMVNGESSRGRAQADWLTDFEVGRHVCAILDAPEMFPETILQLKSCKQVGRPDKAE